MLQVSRRSLLQSSALGAIVSPLAANAFAAPASAAVTGAKFTGHTPGKIYVGLTGYGFDIESRTGKVGLRRTFHKWDGITRELKLIKADHAANRMPWTSFKPPGNPGTTWKQIGDGLHDAAIRSRARSYATLTKPVIVTFNHEPHTDNAPPAEFARAWCRIHDIMKAETGLKNVISAPILGEWTWNPTNRRHDPADWITASVLSRCHFLGIDVYQNRGGETYEQRVGRVLSWLDVRGHNQKMVGIGESACTDDYSSIKGGPWWRASWQYATARIDRFTAIAYFNSDRNNSGGVNWLLTQSATKMAAYSESVRSANAATLA